MKKCARCGEAKPLDDFHQRKRGGRYSYCRPCQRVLNREGQRRWRARHPEKARAQSTAGSRKRRAEQPDYFRNWYRAHADTERARLREYMRRWRAANPAADKDRRDRFRARHPNRIRLWERENTNRRRAQMAAASPKTARYMTELLKEPCAYCGVTENMTVDHIVPLSRGGKHEPANLAPACVTCNCSKGAKLVDEWLSSSSTG